MQNSQYDNFTNDIHESQNRKGKQAKVETEEQDHANLHFSGCYDDYCTIHKSEKDGANWYPRKPRGRKQGQRQRHRHSSWRQCYKDDCEDHYSWKKKDGYFPRRAGAWKKFEKIETLEPGSWGCWREGDEPIQFVAEETQQRDDEGDENAIWAKAVEEGTQKSSQETEEMTKDEEMSDIETEIIEHVSYASGNPTPPANDIEGLKKQLKAASKFIEYQKRDQRDRDNHARAQLTKLQEAFLTETTVRIGMQMGLNRLKEMIRNMEEVLNTEIVAMT